MLFGLLFSAFILACWLGALIQAAVFNLKANMFSKETLMFALPVTFIVYYFT